MANRQGHRTHGTKGGKFARKKGFTLDFSAVEEYAEKLEELGGDMFRIKKVVGGTMEKAAKRIETDTVNALSDAYLPAGGVYSQGDTKRQVVRDAKAEWYGDVAEIGLGFDKTKPGAGGFLITGTPKMRPDAALNDMYSRPKSSRGYENQLKKAITDDFFEEVKKVMEE